MVSRRTDSPEPLAEGSAAPSGDDGENAWRWSGAGAMVRRLALTGAGALCALGLGAATAYAVRLPSDLSAPDAPSDQTLLQDELPSVASARAYALDNPPTDAVRARPDTIQLDPDPALSDPPGDAARDDDGSAPAETSPPLRASPVTAEGPGLPPADEAGGAEPVVAAARGL